MKRQTIRFSAAATALAIALGFALPAPAQQAAPPLTLEAAERAFGLGQASDQLDYDSRRASADRITYQDVALNDFVQADRMTLQVVEGDGGRREAVVRLEGARLTGLDAFSLRAVELTGIDPRLIGPELFDLDALMSGEIEIAGDLQLEGLEFRMDEETPPVRLARIRLDNIDTTEGYASFDAFELNGFSYKPAETELAVDTIRVAGISDAVFRTLASLGAGDEFDASQLTVGEFSIKGVTVTGFSGLSGLLADLQEDPRMGARKALAAARDWVVALRDGEPLTQLAMLSQPADDGTDADPEALPEAGNMSVDFRLGEFTLRNIGLFERLDFVMKGLNTSYELDNTRSQFSVDELSFDDLNIPLLTAYYVSDLMELPEAQLERSVASFVPEGPIGTSATAFALKGVSFSGEGMSASLDQLVFEPVRNDAGKLIALQVPAGRLVMRDTSEEGALREAVGAFGLEELTVDILPNRATWDPATDMTHQEAFGISVPGLFTGSFDFRAQGYQTWMNETTLAEILDVQREVVEQAADSMRGAGTEGVGGALLTSWVTGLELSLGTYEGVTLHDGGVMFRDDGILTTLARQAAEKDGTTPEEARVSMAADFASTAADKSAPLWERLLSNAIRSFITEGGLINFRVTPVPPLPFTQLDDTDIDMNRLGVRIEHAPSAPAARGN